MSIQINTKKLLSLAERHEWGHACRVRLLLKSGQKEPPIGLWEDHISLEDLAQLPETIDYLALCGHAGGELLDIYESVDGAHSILHGGRLLLDLAKEFFLPEIPVASSTWAHTGLLLQSFEGYLGGTTSAEDYMAAAFHYRGRFGTTFGNTNKDQRNADLYDAMPSDGLESVIALDGWVLASHWDSFGRFLVRRRPEFEALEALREEGDGEIFVQGDGEADEEATDTFDRLIDEHIAIYRKEELEKLDDLLVVLVEKHLAMLVDGVARVDKSLGNASAKLSSGDEFLARCKALRALQEERLSQVFGSAGSVNKGA